MTDTSPLLLKLPELLIPMPSSTYVALTDFTAVVVTKRFAQINDYNIENTGAKATAMLNLVKSLLAQGAPLDGVGFQCHFIVGEVPTSFQSVLEQFTALGLEVAITELDIRMTLPSTAALLAQQKTDYQNVIAACNNVKGCIGATIWDYTDKVRLFYCIIWFARGFSTPFITVLLGPKYLLRTRRCLPMGFREFLRSSAFFTHVDIILF